MWHAVKPGTRLAGRYRLLGPGGDPLGTLLGGTAGAVPGADGVPTWLAHDEMLNRPVSLRVLAADAPYADAVLRAARRAAGVDDPRFLAILDAADCGGLAYVVSEWVDAVSLVDLLASGPLAPTEARWVAAEVARALSVAHAAGLAHRCLVPEAVLRTENGRIKVTGLAVDAALRGVAPDVDGIGRIADLRAAGAVLYAGLTGRWPLPGAVPGPGATRLPAAPRAYGAPCAPHQVRAAVPDHLDVLACRALGAPLRRGAAPLDSVGRLADALVGPVGSAGESGTGPLPVVLDDADGVPLLAAPAGLGRAGRAAVALVGVLMLLGVGLLAWQVAVAAARPSEPQPAPRTSSSASPAPTPPARAVGREVPVSGATDFDPEGTGDEHPDLVPRALDGDPDTAWTTLEYYNAPLGGLKSGVGLVVDLARPTDFTTVTLGLIGWGSDVELRTASGSHPPAAAADYRLVDRAEGAGSVVTLRVERPVRARYLLVWFTRLPPSGEASFRGGVTELWVRT